MDEFPWYVVAKSLLGEKEGSGSLDNQKIVELFRLVGHVEIKDDEVAWCAAFVGACLELAGYKSNGSLSARSYLKFGEPLAEPLEGCIVVFWRESRSSGKGHVGFYLRRDDEFIYVLGGNQSDGVREQGYPIDRWLGYRMPVEEGPMATSRLIRNYAQLKAGTQTVDRPVAVGAASVAADAWDDEAEDDAAQLRGMIEDDESSPAAPEDADVLKGGSSGTAVEQLQQALKDKGFAVGGIDGKFGPMTEAAVFSFQRANGLAGTGIADAEMLKALIGGRGPQLSQERLTKTESGLEGLGSEIMADARYGKWISVAVAVLGALGITDTAFIPKLAEIAGSDEGKAVIANIFDKVGTGGGLWVALAGAGLYGWRMFNSAALKRVEDHRSGMNRGQ